MANIHRQTPNLHFHTKKSLLLYAASAGALIAIVPNNLNHFMHSVGSALVIGSVFILDLILIEEKTKGFGPIKPILITSLISLLVIFYTASFFFNTPAKQPSQKICLISLLLVLYSCTRYKPRNKEGFYPLLILNVFNQ